MPSFTRSAIKASFLKLLDQRPLNQITVKDIVEDCGINRNSFYFQFADIPALATEIITENADRIIQEHAGADSLEECLSAAAQFALEHKRAVMHMYRSTQRDAYEQHLLRVCQHVVTAYAEAAFGDMPILPEDRDIVIRFYKCQCFGQILEWLNNNMSYDIERQFCRLGQLWKGMTSELVRRCADAAAQERPSP